MVPVGRKDDAGKPDWSLIPLWTLPWLQKVGFKPASKLKEVIVPLGGYQSIWLVKSAETEEGFCRTLVIEMKADYLARALVAGLSCLGYQTLEEGLESLIPVLAYGAKKYGRFNWLHVDPERYLAAAVRHLHSWEREKKVDEESGLHSGLHALANLLILLGLETNDERHENDKGFDQGLPGA